MRCPYCKDLNTGVIDSRPNSDHTSIRRRRLCNNCGKRFTSYEKIETQDVMVIKKDGQKEAFNIDKIRNGISRACYKRDVSQVDIDSLAEDIYSQIINTGLLEVESQYIGQLIMSGLKDLDEVAYVRFASVYKSFKDVSSFTEVVEGYKKDKSGKN